MDQHEGNTSLMEQAVGAEMGYYRQTDLFAVTAEDLASWQRSEQVWATAGSTLDNYRPYSFTRHLLERHGYSLHRYMAKHLSPVAWACWFAQGGILAPFRRK